MPSADQLKAQQIIGIVNTKTQQRTKSRSFRHTAFQSGRVTVGGGSDIGGSGK